MLIPAGGCAAGFLRRRRLISDEVFFAVLSAVRVIITPIV